MLEDDGGDRPWVRPLDPPSGAGNHSRVVSLRKFTEHTGVAGLSNFHWVVGERQQ